MRTSLFFAAASLIALSDAVALQQRNINLGNGLYIRNENYHSPKIPDI